MSDIQIRRATRADMPAVHSLVRELAIYEKAEEQVETTPEIYAEDAFGDQPIFACFVAETPEKEVVGIALYYIGYSTWKGKLMYLDDLVISESHRRQGIGRMLIDQLVAYALEINCRMIRWQVLDWNEPAIKMYETLGVRFDHEWVDVKMTRTMMEAHKPRK